MPETAIKTGPKLGIRLDREHATFTLPDTVVGHVFRGSHLVTSEAVVKIKLVGRSKSKIVIRRGHWSSPYRARYSLVNESDYTYTLLKGPVHIPADGDGHTWPFAITLPTQYDSTWTASGTGQDESYLPLQTDGSALHNLPPSFEAQKWGLGEGMGCFIEYYLQAELTTTSRGKSETVDAIQPLIITTLDRGTGSRRVRWSTSRSTQSLKRSGIMTAGDTAQDASSNPTTQSAVASSSFDFVMVVRTPTTLQLDHPDPVNFLLLAEPKLMGGLDVALLTSQNILVTEVVVHLIASTRIKSPSKRGAREASTETKFKLSTKDSPQISAALHVPWMRNADSTNDGARNPDAAPASSDRTQAINAGRHLGLRLPDKRFPDQIISESFTTHNIKHSHRLEWKVTVDIAGQSFTSSGGEAVEVLPPSSDDQPMEYADLEAESLARARTASVEALPPEYEHIDRQPSLPRREPRQTRVGEAAQGLSRLWADF